MSERQRFAVILVLPVVLSILIFSVYPSLKAIYISLFEHRLVSYEFIGLANYLALLQESNFWFVVVNTIWWTVLTLGFSFLLGLGAALLLNREYFGSKFFQSILLIPWIAAPIATTFVWRRLYSIGQSPINDLLIRIGLIDTDILFLGDVSLGLGLSLPMVSVVIVGVWRNFPFMTLMLLAGLKSIPGVLYEAAKVDGASSWQELCFITLPLLKPVASVSCLLMGIWLFKSFDIAYLIAGGGPRLLTSLLSVRVYQLAFNIGRFGYAAAIGVAMFLIMLPATVYYVKSQQSQIREEEAA